MIQSGMKWSLPVPVSEPQFIIMRGSQEGHALYSVLQWQKKYMTGLSTLPTLFSSGAFCCACSTGTDAMGCDQILFVSESREFPVL